MYNNYMVLQQMHACKIFYLMCNTAYHKRVICKSYGHNMGKKTVQFADFEIVWDMSSLKTSS